MNRLVAILALISACMPALAVQEVFLKDVPPLQELHNCKHSDGKFMMQVEPCGPDTTEYSSLLQMNSDGKGTYLPLGSTMDGPPVAPATQAATGVATKPIPGSVGNAAELSPEAQKKEMADFRKRMAKWLGFALIFGIVAKLIGRSFFLWFAFGFVLRMVLVALNVIAF